MHKVVLGLHLNLTVYLASLRKRPVAEILMSKSLDLNLIKTFSPHFCITRPAPQSGSRSNLMVFLFKVIQQEPHI